MPRTALILAGHGSHISPNTAALVWQTVDELRRLNVADEVTAAFWKEQPSFATVFDSLTADDVTVVPLFTAQGYFTRTVIPAEMGIDPDAPLPSVNDRAEEAIVRATQTRTNLKRIRFTDHAAPMPLMPDDVAPGAKTIRYARTLGEHRKIAEIVKARVEDAIRASGRPRDQIAVALIGHATRRNPDSRKATEAQAMFIRATVPVREVIAVYLDDAPSIPDVYALTDAPCLIAVPYFLAAGSHTTLDVPEALGIGAGQTSGEVNGRSVLYTAPIGSLSEMVEMAFDLALDTGAPLKAPHLGSAWDAFPYAGRAIVDNLLADAPVTFGQLYISRDDVRHAADAGRDDLTQCDTPHALRQITRENPFRPLATSADLPAGWRAAHLGSAARLHAIIETVYPGVLGTSRRVRRDGIDANAWLNTIQRQTGQYRPLETLNSAAREAVIGAVCGKCVLRPAWANAEISGNLLCREPCNVWLSTAIENIP